jgi:pimeloyl-ACP methyl ester carboxylesterase
MTLMQAVYCISGLGADERIFKKLRLNNAEVHFMQWIAPEKNESIGVYASRLKEQIRHYDPILMGVSFGGMMAIEVARIISAKTVILISSIRSHHQLPLWMKGLGATGADRLLPRQNLESNPFLKMIRPIEDYFLGVTSEEEKKIADEYREHIDPQLLKWSIKQVLNWKNDWTPENLYHLHGSEDHIFPVKRSNPTHVIPRAGHFMVMTHHNEVSKILQDII